MATDTKRNSHGNLFSKHDPFGIIATCIIIAYGLVTVITPNMDTLDWNGPKFMSLSFLNLLAFFYLFIHKEINKNKEWFLFSFKSWIGLVYLLLMLISLISFFKAINILESVVHFSKLFTIFSAAYFVSILFYKEKRSLLYLSIVMSILLLFDSITVFIEIIKFIKGEFNSISDIISVYSNKNILGASIFIKIPFALWLMIFRTKWLRSLGVVAIFAAQLATLIMSTRAFYLGLIFLTLALIIYFTIRYKQDKRSSALRLMMISLISVILAISAYSIIAKYFYPKGKDIYTVGVGDRLATINTGDARLSIWKRTINLIKEEPLLGVGVGNWKIKVLKEENLTSPGFILNYKAHNDFLETTAETGIFGGFLFLSIFVILIWKFGKKLISKATDEELSFLFLPAFGLIAYSFDAFFNFPQDRPEISALFAIYVGAAIAFAGDSPMLTQKISSFFKKAYQKRILKVRLFLSILIAVILIGSSAILYFNVKSLQVQFVVHSEVRQGKLQVSAAKIIDKFPLIPDINVVGEPIAVQKARYLVKEERYDEAIAMLKNDNSSPFDSRKEFFLSQAYYNKRMMDSAYYYADVVYQLKPNFFINIQHMCRIMLQQGNINNSIALLDNYFLNNNYDADAWLYAYSFYSTVGLVKKAVATLDSALYYLPGNQKIVNLKETISDVFYNQTYVAAMDAYNKQEFEESARLFSFVLEKDSICHECRIKRAFSYNSTGDYEKSNIDLNYLIDNEIIMPNMYNLIGVNHYFLENNTEACENFKIAMELGDKEGVINYKALCAD